MKFSLKLDRLMHRHGANQQAVASAIGVSQKAVSKWVNGHATPGHAKMADLAGFFGVSVDSLSDDTSDLPIEQTGETPGVYVIQASATAEAWARQLGRIRDNLHALLGQVEGLYAQIAGENRARAMARHLKDLPPTPADHPRRAGRKTGEG